jgi:allophanate hydrolase
VYLAVEGGFAVASILGSVSTFARGRCGGFNGRALRAEDRLPLRLSSVVARPEQASRFVIPVDHVVRIVLGPQDDYFTAEGLSDFASSPYSICAGSDRMAMRLKGKPISLPRGHDLTSDAISLGSIQIAGDGQPIVLLADRQTTGGYPKVATVISADIAKLGRLAIGQEVRFNVVDFRTAVEARQELLGTLQRLELSISPVSQGSEAARTTALMTENLISGVVSAEAAA